MEPPPSDAIPYRAELLRKAIHLLALVIPLGMTLLGKATALLVLVPLTLLALTADVLRVRSEAFARFIRWVFGYLMRAEEQPPVGGPVAINGATWVLVSATLLLLVFPLHIAVASFVMFMISDAAAALIGRRFGRHRWGGTNRTVEGSLGFLAAGLGVVALLPGIVFWTGAVGVVLACLAEIPSGPLNDNVRVPLVAATVLFLLERFALGHDVALFFG
ncbi:phosphatidate cytidylyltransferase [Rhodothermaceae bacterium RA]|nr:phosphatidate cytidylyltransferase [Rhodothermaceae bacterium RA]